MTTGLGAVVLVGMMGTGKSTVGALVADRLGRRLYDSDAMVEARTGRTVASLWAEGGEAAFRTLETEVLDEALAADPPGVIAAAGGVVLAPANRAQLQRTSERGGVVVWLRADPAVLAGRVHTGDHRPLLADDPAGTLRKMASDREVLYEEVADRRIDTSALPAPEVADLVLEAVGWH